jgi:hypothetical protein
MYGILNLLRQTARIEFARAHLLVAEDALPEGYSQVWLVVPCPGVVWLVVPRRSIVFAGYFQGSYVANFLVPLC